LNWFRSKVGKDVPDRMQPTEMIAKSGNIAEQAELIPYPTSPSELYLMRQYTPILQTVCIKLRDEIWRKPPYVEKEYANRCPSCKINYEADTPECEKCGGPTVEPDDKGRRIIEAFMTKMNDSDQDLIKVGKMFEDDTNTTDDGWLIGVKDYIVDKKGNIIDYEPMEIYRGRPGKIWLVRDRMLRKTGEDYQLKRGFFTCVLHREGNLQTSKGDCKKCGRKLHPVTEVALDHEARPMIGYLDGEVCHDSRYQPSELYGFSNILCLWTLAQTLINMDSQQNRTYKHDRPPKMALFINTDNPQQFNELAKKQDEKKAKNPNYVPRYAFNSSRGGGTGGGNPVNVVNFTPSYTDLQNIEQRKEIRERISALYGVSNILVNDTSSSGGLNNEGLQIRVTTRAVETAHTQYHERVFKWIVKFLQVEGWVIRFPEPIEADKAAIQTRKAQNFMMLLQLVDRKVKPTIDDSEDLTFSFDIDELEPMQQQFGGGFGGGPNGEENVPPSGERPSVSQGPRGGRYYTNPGSGQKIPLASGQEPPIKAASAYIQNGNNRYPVYVDSNNDTYPIIKSPGGSTLSLPASDDGVPITKYLDQRIRNLFPSGILSDVQKIYKYGTFENTTEKQSKKIVDMIFKELTKDTELSFVTNNIGASINRIAPNANASNIAMTEVDKIVNIGRTIRWKKDDPDGDRYLYRLVGTRANSCKAHKSLVQKVGKGVPLSEFKDLMKATRDEYFPGMTYSDDDPFFLHPQEQHRPYRRRKT